LRGEYRQNSFPVVPAGLFVRGKDAEIKHGASFTAFVDADTLLSPANKGGLGETRVPPPYALRVTVLARRF